MLEAGADIDAADGAGRTPIFYAATFSLHEAVNFLARKECVLHTLSSAPKDGLKESLLEHVIRSYRYITSSRRRPSKEFHIVLSTIIRHVVERRRELEVLARTLLDAKSVQSLRLSTEAVLDRLASRAISMLRKKTNVPAWLTNLTPEHGTVYHIYPMKVEAAQMLWDAGFRGTDEPDRWGLSPLMIHYPWYDYYANGWELATWLVAKGANLHRRQERVFLLRYEDGDQKIYLSSKASSTTALHYLAAIWGDWPERSFHPKTNDVGRFLSPLEDVSEPGRRLILHVLSEPLPDSCKCACSAMGCRAYTMMAKCLVTNVRDYGWNSVRPREGLLQVSQAYAQLLSVDQPSLAWLRSEVIRFNTFEKLDLRHTCCEINNYRSFNATVICEPYDDQELHEIQEEQAEQMEKLETLLIEFENKYEESGSTLSEFLNGYWKDRMNEVLSEEGAVDHEALKEMGIVLRKEDRPSPWAYDDDEPSSRLFDADSPAPSDDQVKELEGL